jgi:hypothetical protein
MKSGHIQQYTHLSEFKTVKEFNETVKAILLTYRERFTKGERIALEQLTRFCVKHIGVCNARISKLVEATHQDYQGISRSTFERMIRKAKQLGFLSVHHTIRTKGGLSHNVYVFHRFDGAHKEKLTDRPERKNPVRATAQRENTATKTTLLEKKPKKNQDLRSIPIEQLDYTFVPSHVPTQFTKTVKPFFNQAKQICKLWDRALIAYRSMRFDEPIEWLLPIITKAFKETVYRFKQKKIKTEFNAYFYGTLSGLLVVEKRKLVAKKRGAIRWLVQD